MSPPETVFSVKNKLPVRFGMEPEHAVHLPFRFGSKPLNGLRAQEPSSALSGTFPHARGTGEDDNLKGFAFARERSEWEKVPDRADEGSWARNQFKGFEPNLNGR